MNDNNVNRGYLPLLHTYSQVDVAMIKSLLEGNVDFYFKDENFMTVRPLLEPSVLMVNEKDYDEVKELLSDFDLNYMAISLKDDDGDKSE
jgi:hypothetical protein